MSDLKFNYWYKKLITKNYFKTSELNFYIELLEDFIEDDFEKLEHIIQTKYGCKINQLEKQYV